VLQGAADISYQRRGSSYNPDEYDRRISLVAEQAQVCTLTSYIMIFPYVLSTLYEWAMSAITPTSMTDASAWWLSRHRYIYTHSIMNLFIRVAAMERSHKGIDLTLLIVDYCLLGVPSFWTACV
jgi:hypothetical protein